MADLVERIRNRIHDAPIPTERLLDEAAETIEAMLEALEAVLRDFDERREIGHRIDIAEVEVMGKVRAAIAQAKGEGK